MLTNVLTDDSPVLFSLSKEKMLLEVKDFGNLTAR